MKANTPLPHKALICGATGGIGKATAELMLSRNIEVVLLARNKEKLQSVCNELEKNTGKTTRYLQADFEDPSSVRNVVTEYVEEHGGFDILLNNTGGPKPGPLHLASVDELVSGFKMHIVCSQLIMQANLKHMKNNGWGRIINVISTSVKQPLDGLGVSNTIRGASANWAKTLANELGPFGITVNNILPGATNTSRLDSIIDGKSKRLGLTKEEVVKKDHATIPLRRYGKAEETAQAICFLASTEANYITGINLPVDGGRTKSL